MLASFLLVRKVDPNATFPLESATETANPRAKGKASKSKSKKADKNKEKVSEADKDKGKADDKEKDKPQEKSNDKPEPSATEPKPDGSKTPASNTQADQKAEASGTPNKPSADKDGSNDKKADTKDKDKDNDKEKENKEKEKAKDSNLKEYYQPVTFRIFTNNPKVLEPLGRVVKPPDEVRKYMNEIMDRAERAPEGFLAYRLPREEPDDNKPAPELEDSGKKTGTPVPAARGRLQSRSKTVDEESGDENIEKPVEEEEEEELKDFYGPPTGLPPMGA